MGAAATLLVLTASVGLSLYVANLNRYDQIYEQVGAIIVLMLWLYVTGLMVLIGAEMNAVLAVWYRSERVPRSFSKKPRRSRTVLDHSDLRWDRPTPTSKNEILTEPTSCASANTSAGYPVQSHCEPL